MSTFPTRTLAAGAVASVSLALFGCAPAADEPAGAGELIPLTVAIAPIFNEPFYYGIESGIFEEHGFDVSVVPGADLPAQLVPLLVSGEADIAMAGNLTVINGVIEGLQIKAVAPLSTASDQPEPPSGLIVAPDSPLHGYADLNGTTIAVPGLNEITHLATMYAIDENGGDSSTVEFLEMPITNVNDALLNGQIDAAVQVGAFYSLAVAAGFGTFGSPSNDYLPGSVNIQMMATDQWIAENEETLTEFNVALAEVIDDLNANPETIREVQREYTELPDELIDIAILPLFFTEFDRAGIERTIELAYEYGMIGSEPAVDDVVWSGAAID